MKLQISPQRWTGLSKADKLKFPQINMAHLEFWAVLGLRGSKWSSSPWRGQGVLEPRVKVICWGTWLLSGTTQTQLSCVKFPLQAAALSIPSWSSQFHADPLDPCKLVLSAFPGLGLILIGFILFLCCALSQALFWCRTEQTLFCQCRCCSSVE